MIVSSNITKLRTKKDKLTGINIKNKIVRKQRLQFWVVLTRIV